MSGHTKGPWRISSDVAHRVVDDFATIAHCNVSSRESDEAAANARLIASAPELLYALKYVLDVREIKCRDHPAAGRDGCCANCIARAAIAKAEGGN